MAKSEDAFRTIGELSEELGVAQHILRYWETRFPQLRPMQRAGNRRYYRPADVALARRIHMLLNDQGYTIKGVQKLLAEGGEAGGDAPAMAADARSIPADIIDQLRALRDDLARAIEQTANPPNPEAAASP